MAGRIVLRDTAIVVLSGIMAISLVGALIGVIVAIVRYGQPDADSATLVADTFAWIFAAAFFATFGLTLTESLNGRQTEH